MWPTSLRPTACLILSLPFLVKYSAEQTQQEYSLGAFEKIKFKKTTLLALTAYVPFLTLLLTTLLLT